MATRDARIVDGLCVNTIEWAVRPILSVLMCGWWLVLIFLWVRGRIGGILLGSISFFLLGKWCHVIPRCSAVDSASGYGILDVGLWTPRSIGTSESLTSFEGLGNRLEHMDYHTDSKYTDLSRLGTVLDDWSLVWVCTGFIICQMDVYRSSG